jgi:hypothetical protein
VIEFPLKDFLPIVNGLRAAPGVVIYDLLDDWNTALGGDWYSLQTEKAIIEASQVLIATEASLLKRLEALSQRPVSLLPNAVNSQLFDPRRTYPRPADFPACDWSIIYIGAYGVSGSIGSCSTKSHRRILAAVVMIGDYCGQCPDPPSNLHFWLKPPARFARLPVSCPGCHHPLDGQLHHPGYQPAKSV